MNTEVNSVKNDKTKKARLIGLWAVIIIICVLLGIFYYHYSSFHPSTDDAYINANIAQISAQINGPVAEIYVENNQFVKKGQLLFILDARPFQFSLNKAEAQLALTEQQIQANIAAVAAAQAELDQANANYEVAKKNVPRTLTLVKENELPKALGVTEQGHLDMTKAAVTAAQSQLQEAIQNLGKSGADNASLQAAQANVDQAKLNLSYTKIYAPATGYLANFSLRPGSMVTANQPLFALIENDLWWADANYKETDLAKIKVGQKAKIILDIYPGHVFKGIVQSISSGSGTAFSLLPPENATGNWVKVTQRFPVKVLILDLSPQFPLRVGASATVTINAT